MNPATTVPTAQRWGLSASTLKVIACIAMVIDHLGAYIWDDLRPLRIIGRLAFPIFAYFIAEGCRYTRRKTRRFLLVFGLGLLCETVFFLYSGQINAGILMTFSLSILLIYQLQALKKSFAQKAWGMVVLWTLLLAASLVGVWSLMTIVRVDYGFWGVLIPVFTALPDYKEGESPGIFRYLSNRPVKLAFCALGMLLLCISRGLTTNLQSYCLFALIPLALYNGRPGIKRMKYGFYVFYPLHLIVIFLLEMLLRG